MSLLLNDLGEDWFLEKFVGVILLRDSVADMLIIDLNLEIPVVILLVKKLFFEGF